MTNFFSTVSAYKLAGIGVFFFVCNSPLSLFHMLSRHAQPNAWANGRQSRRSSSTLTSVPRRQLQQRRLSPTPDANNDNDDNSAPPRKRQRQDYSDSEGDDEDENFQGCVLL